MTDRYEKIRKALEMGPTPGPWYGDDNSVSCLWSNGTAGIREYIALPDSAEDSTPNPADMHFIAACDPDTIRALLDERDALLDALRQIAEWPDGGNRYGQGNIKRFAQAAIDAAKQLFLKLYLLC